LSIIKFRLECFFIFLVLFKLVFLGFFYFVRACAALHTGINQTPDNTPSNTPIVM